MENKLEKLEHGDLVVYHSRYGEKIATVDRVTRTMVFVEGRKFSKKLVV